MREMGGGANAAGLRHIANLLVTNASGAAMLFAAG